MPVAIHASEAIANDDGLLMRGIQPEVVAAPDVNSMQKQVQDARQDVERQPARIPIDCLAGQSGQLLERSPKLLACP